MPPGRTAPAYIPPEEEILPPPSVAGGYSSYVPPADAAPPPLPVEGAAPPPPAPSYATEPYGGNDTISPVPESQGYGTAYYTSAPAPYQGPAPMLQSPSPQVNPSQFGQMPSEYNDPLLSGRTTPYQVPAQQAPPVGGAPQQPISGRSLYSTGDRQNSLGDLPPSRAAGGALTPPAGSSNLLADYYNGAASHARSMKVAPKPKKWTKGDYEIAGRMLLGMGFNGANGMTGQYGAGVAGQEPQRQNTSGTGTLSVPEWGGFNMPFGINGDGVANLLWGSTPTVDPSLNGQSMQNEDPANPAWRPTQTGPTLQDQLLTLGGQAIQSATSGIAAQNAANLEAQGILTQQEQTRADQRREAGRQAGGAPGGMSLPSFSSGLSGPGGAESGIPGLPPIPTYTPPGPGGSGGTSRSAGGTMGPGGIGSGSGGYVRPYIPGASLPPLPTSTPSTPRNTATPSSTSDYVRPYIPGESLPFNIFQQNGLVSGDGSFTEAGYRELRDTLGWISQDGLWTPQAAAQNAIPPESVGRPANPYEMRDPANVTPAAEQPAAPPASDAGQPLDPNAVLPVTPAEVAAVEGTGNYNASNDWSPRWSNNRGGSSWGGSTSTGRRSRRSSGSYGSDDGGSWEDFRQDFDGDGDVDEKDDRKAKMMFAKRKKTRRGKRGGRTTVNYQSTPMREEILATIEKSRNKEK